MLACAICVAAAAACSSKPGRGANETATVTPVYADAGALDATAPTTRERDAEPEPDAQVVTEPHDAAAPILDAPGLADPCGEHNVEAIPSELSCTGLYADIATKTIAPNVRAYTPGLPFWSDGAEKARWIYLPPGETIDTTDMDGWVFPVDTKLWKEFKIGGARIETRLYWKKSAFEWVSVVYRWSHSENHATRLVGGEKNVNGTTYEVPPESVCSQCHDGSRDKVLGFDAVSLAHSGAAGATLAELVAAGRLTVAPAKTELVIPDDGTGKAAAALGWLHANCGNVCHNPSDGAAAKYVGLSMRLNAKELLVTGRDAGAARVRDLPTYVTAVNRDVSLSPYAAEGFKRIKPGDVAKSLVHFLASRPADSAERRMPPLMVHTPDPTGTALVSAWIAAMPADAGP